MGSDYVTGGFYQSAPCQECAALRRELTSYRELPLVPAEEYRRACQQRDAAQNAADAMAGELAEARDRRIVTQAGRTLAHLNAVLRTLCKETGGIEDERIRNAARAHLVECGIVAPELDEMRAAYGEWEAKHA